MAHTSETDPYPYEVGSHMRTFQIPVEGGAVEILHPQDVLDRAMRIGNFAKTEIDKFVGLSRARTPYDLQKLYYVVSESFNLRSQLQSQMSTLHALAPHDVPPRLLHFIATVRHLLQESQSAANKILYANSDEDVDNELIIKLTAIYDHIRKLQYGEWGVMREFDRVWHPANRIVGL